MIGDNAMAAHYQSIPLESRAREMLTDWHRDEVTDTVAAQAYADALIARLALADLVIVSVHLERGCESDGDCSR